MNCFGDDRMIGSEMVTKHCIRKTARACCFNLVLYGPKVPPFKPVLLRGHLRTNPFLGTLFWTPVAKCSSSLVYPFNMVRSYYVNFCNILLSLCLLCFQLTPEERAFLISENKRLRIQFFGVIAAERGMAREEFVQEYRLQELMAALELLDLLDHCEYRAYRQSGGQQG